MYGQSIAALMAVESTRRHLTEALPETRPRAPRRTAALLLQRAAHRLDPCATVAPRVTLGR